jgi:hypothetical protein
MSQLSNGNNSSNGIALPDHARKPFTIPGTTTRRPRRYERRGAAGADHREQGVGVIAAVGDNVSAFQTGEQLRRGVEIVGLSGRQY